MTWLDDPPLFALIDESADNEHYRITAVIVDSRDPGESELHEGLEAVMDRVEASYGIPATTELHGHDMFHGKEGWAALHRMPRARIGIYRQALEVVADTAEAIIIRGVHRPRFRTRYASRPDWNEHESVLTFVLEDIDAYAERRRRPVYAFADDCRFAKSALASFEEYRVSGTWGYRSRVIEQVKEVRFVDSSEYRQIQGADLVSYLNHRILSRRDTREDAKRANAQLWSIVQPRVIANRTWRP